MMTRTILMAMGLFCFVLNAPAQTQKPKAHTAKKSALSKPKPVVSRPRPATVILKNEGTGISGDITAITLDKISLLIEGKIYSYKLDDIASISFESPEAAQSSTQPTDATTPGEQSPEATSTAQVEPAATEPPAFGDIPANQKITTKENGGTLYIEAGIVYNHGGVEPVGRVEFILLDSNTKMHTAVAVRNILGLSSYTTDADMWELFEHTVQSVTTDFNGHATFKPVIPGQYYVSGITQTRGGFVTWNIPIQIAMGENFLTLDHNNAQGF